MYRVINTINLSRRLRVNKRVLVILDLVVDRDDPKVPFREGSQVRVRKSDETLFMLAVSRVEVNPAGVVGLFFSQLSATEILRGSLVELLDSASTS